MANAVSQVTRQADKRNRSPKDKVARRLGTELKP